MKPELAKLISSFRKLSPISWLRTGIHPLDLIIGGGVPVGRVIEIFGNEQAGKSLFAWTIARAFQKAGGVVGLCDVEATAPKDFMQSLGLDVDKIAQPLDPVRTVEDVRDFVKEFTLRVRKIDKECPLVVIWDSVAATSARGAWEDEEEFVPKIHDTGQMSQAMSKFFREFTQFMAENHVTLVGVNQLRDKIGVMFGRKDESPGGRALKFYSSVRIELTKGKKIEKSASTVGVMCHARVVKNKCATPLRKANTQILWGKGFDEIAGLEEVLEEIGRIKKNKKSGNFEAVIEQGSVAEAETAISFKSDDLAKVVAEHPGIIAPWIF